MAQLLQATQLDDSTPNAESIPSPCKICLKEAQKYTCPRCNIVYCSVVCYQSKKHSSCSEAFYKEWVLDELKDSTNSSEDREKVMKMLARDLEERGEDDITGDEEDDSVEDEDIAERLDGLDLDNDVSTVWSRLTSKEKEEFARMLQDGRLAKLIEIWTPWWKVGANHKLVKDDNKDMDERTTVPDIESDIPDINALLKNSKPSSNCRFDVLNILVSYVFMARLHNGGHAECPVDSLQDLLDVCIVFEKSHSCTSVGEAVQLALDSITKKMKDSERYGNHFNISLLKDLKILVSGPGKNSSLTFMAAALSDIFRLLKNAQSILKRELRDKVREGGWDLSDLKGLKSSMLKAERKTLFLLSWLQRYGMGIHQAELLLQFEIETRESQVEDVQEMKSIVEENLDKLRPQPSDASEANDKPANPMAGKIVELD